MLVECRGFGEQAIKGDQSSDRGKEGEQAIKNHARSHGQEPIFPDALIGSPQDVFPASPRDLPRRAGMPAAAGLKAAPLLSGLGFRAGGMPELLSGIEAV